MSRDAAGPGTGPSVTQPPVPTRPAQRRRLALSAGIAAGVVVAAGMVIPTYAEGGDPDDTRSADFLEQRHRTRALALTAGAAAPDPGDGRSDAAPAHTSGDGHDHDHTDPSTKNAISRSEAADDPLAVDPTTRTQQRINAAAVAAQRLDADPALLPGKAPEPRRAVPEDRYAMAGGCYTLGTADGWVRADGDGFRVGSAAAGAPLHFQATDLGRYLLFTGDRGFISRDTSTLGRGGDGIGRAAAPGPAAEWTVRGRGPSYRLTTRDGSKGLAVADDGSLVLAARPAPFRLRLTDGCAGWPEITTNVTGRPHRGETPYAEVRGYADAHTHHMAFEFLGGKVHCGRPWHRYGVEHALVDCEDHTASAGKGAALESFLSGDLDGHDPVGWPTFRDWPAPDSLTHEGTYHRWMERAWRGGLRLFVNLLVENNKLCEVYPLKKNSCDDMDSIRLQAKRMRQFERYVDAQHGGPGEGWYRIVTSPFEAREVINDGKLAVVMGIETSVVFGCSMKATVPQCTKRSIRRQLDAVHRMGVRQMELVNKFDNALAGVAGDSGATGVAVNSANFLETGSYWRMRTCPQQYGEGVHDKEQYAAPREVSDRDPLFGAIADTYLPPAPVAGPVYGPAPHCNELGLSGLGAFTIRQLAQRRILFDPDHMSVLARKASLDLVERLDYPGILSSHSWSTPDAYPRIAEMGGFIAPYAGDSTGFVKKWRYHVGRADPRYYFGLGFGADINGLGAQGDPRGADAPDPVTYPFEGLGGVTVDQQVSGERVYDINVDGVAHYGLYPDWIEDLRRLAGDAIVEDLARGAEAYLQTWERAVGVTPNACTDASLLLEDAQFRTLPRGASPEAVLRRVGQPDTRLGNRFGYCAIDRDGQRSRVDVVFDRAGRLARVV